MITLFVPCDSAALAAGADEVVDALHKEASSLLCEGVQGVCLNRSNLF